MDASDVRHAVRKAIRTQIREAAKAANLPPKTFYDYKRRVVSELKSLGASEQLLDEADDDYGPLFEALWESWHDVEVELRDARDVSEMKRVWSETVDFYVKGVANSIIDIYITSS